MGAMPATTVTLTLAEAAQVLDPPMTERQLRMIVNALELPAAGRRRRAHTGRPLDTYDVAELMRIHAALTPWLTCNEPANSARQLG